MHSSEQDAKGNSLLSYVPPSQWSPTFTTVLSMLRNGFLEFLNVVYNSFQRYPFIIFISCDVNWRIMLQENGCTKNVYYSLWPLSTLQIMKNNYLHFSRLKATFFPFTWYYWEIYSIRVLDESLSGIVFSQPETMTLLKPAQNLSSYGAERRLCFVSRNNLKVYWIPAWAQVSVLLIIFTGALWIIISSLSFTTWGLIFW